MENSSEQKIEDPSFLSPIAHELRQQFMRLAEEKMIKVMNDLFSASGWFYRHVPMLALKRSADHGLQQADLIQGYIDMGRRVKSLTKVAGTDLAVGKQMMKHGLCEGRGVIFSTTEHFSKEGVLPRTKFFANSMPSRKDVSSVNIHDGRTLSRFDDHRTYLAQTHIRLCHRDDCRTGTTEIYDLKKACVDKGWEQIERNSSGYINCEYAPWLPSELDELEELMVKGINIFVGRTIYYDQTLDERLDSRRSIIASTVDNEAYRLRIVNTRTRFILCTYVMRLIDEVFQMISFHGPANCESNISSISRYHGLKRVTYVPWCIKYTSRTEKGEWMGDRRFADRAELEALEEETLVELTQALGTKGVDHRGLHRSYVEWFIENKLFEQHAYVTVGNDAREILVGKHGIDKILVVAAAYRWITKLDTTIDAKEERAEALTGRTFSSLAPTFVIGRFGINSCLCRMDERTLHSLKSSFHGNSARGAIYQMVYNYRLMASLLTRMSIALDLPFGPCVQADLQTHFTNAGVNYSLSPIMTFIVEANMEYGLYIHRGYCYTLIYIHDSEKKFCHLDAPIVPHEDREKPRVTKLKVTEPHTRHLFLILPYITASTFQSQKIEKGGGEWCPVGDKCLGYATFLYRSDPRGRH